MRKRIKYTVISVILVLLISILLPNLIVNHNSVGKTFSSVEKIPKNKVGLVLGTSKYLNNGNINLYFKYRIEATLKLFKSGKIDIVLVSGDNSRSNYDEPSDFKEELIKQGIPSERIYLDYAGFRTLDSVIRAKEIFGLDSFTVISQEFHNQRAIYIGEVHDIKIVGFNAKDLHGRNALKTSIREYFARTKVFIDLIFNVKPKYLGEKIQIT